MLLSGLYYIHRNKVGALVEEERAGLGAGLCARGVGMAKGSLGTLRLASCRSHTGT